MADIQIEASARSDLQEYVARWQVWVDASVGYVFYVDSTSDLVYKKTTNGGSSWGTKQTIDVGTITKFDIWFDQWTPGDSGTVVHITYMDSGTDDVYYRAFDTNGDSLGSEVQVFNGASFTHPGWVSISKARGGRLGIAFDGDGGTETGYYVSADGTTWTSKNSPVEASADIFLLYPGNYADNQDMDAIYWDTSADEISLKTYDDSANSWSEASISGSMADNGATDSQMMASVRHSDGHIILAAWNAAPASTSDLKVWDINGSGSITAKTNVLTDTDNASDAGVFIHQSSGDLYVSYVRGASGSANVYYKKSTDGASTWGTETQVNVTALTTNWVVTTDLGGGATRFEPVWLAGSLADVITNFDNSLALTAPEDQDFDADAQIIEWVSPLAVASFDQIFSAVAGVIEWVLPTAFLSQDRDFAADPSVIEWVQPAAVMVQGRFFTATANVLEWESPAAVASFDTAEFNASPSVIRFVLPLAHYIGAVPVVTIPEVHARDRTAPTLPTVHIHNPWWPRQRIATLTTAHNIDRSWSRTEQGPEPGRAGFNVSVSDPQLPLDDLKGFLVAIESRYTRPWVGTILTLEENDRTGVMAVDCIGIEAIIDGRITAQNLHYEKAIGGNPVFISLMEAANARNHTGILPSIPVELAPPVEDLQIGGQSVMEALNELVGRSGYEWWLEVEVSPRWIDATVLMGYRQGVDLSGPNHYYEGVHFSSDWKSDISQVKHTVTAVGGFGSLLKDRNVQASTSIFGPDLVGLDYDGAEESAADAGRLIASMPAGARNERVSFEVMTDITPEVGRRARTVQERPLAGTELINFQFNQLADWHDLSIGNYFTVHRKILGRPASRLCRVKGFQPDEERGVAAVVAEVAL